MLLEGECVGFRRCWANAMLRPQLFGRELLPRPATMETLSNRKIPEPRTPAPRPPFCLRTPLRGPHIAAVKSALLPNFPICFRRWSFPCTFCDLRSFLGYLHLLPVLLPDILRRCGAYLEHRGWLKLHIGESIVQTALEGLISFCLLTSCRLLPLFPYTSIYNPLFHNLRGHSSSIRGWAFSQT